MEPKIEDIRAICTELKKTAEEMQEILSNKERNEFAIAFLQYVEMTYEKKGDQYYFKHPLMSHVHRDVNEVLNNFLSMTDIGKTYEK